MQATIRLSVTTPPPVMTDTGWSPPAKRPSNMEIHRQYESVAPAACGQPATTGVLMSTM
jgi:hypothetical protein